MNITFFLYFVISFVIFCIIYVYLRAFQYEETFNAFMVSLLGAALWPLILPMFILYLFVRFVLEKIIKIIENKINN